MSDYSSLGPAQNNSQTAGYAAALQRAKLVAAKIEAGGGAKRSLEGGSEPSAKKVAGLEYQPLSPPNMSSVTAAAAAAAAAAARLAATANSQPPFLPEQTTNEYIRVPDKMVGLIIGRGGEQITRLQAESGCKIQMAPDSGGQPERMCTLTGSREAIQRAKDLVNEIVNQRGRENMPPERQGRDQGGGLGGNMEEIMVPAPKVGLIIGKGGETIKQLQERSGAKMIVIQDGPNQEYPLRITGDPNQVEHAKQLIFELLAEKDMQRGGGRGGGGGPQHHDDYDGNGLGGNQHEVLVPRVAVGVVIGKGGDMIKKIQNETGCRVQFHQGREEGPGDKRCILQGKPHQIDQARQMIEDLIDSVNRRDQEGRTRGGGGGGRGQRNGGGGGDFGGQQWNGPGESKVEVTFTVNNVKCGLIIGRGGEVIKQINAQSGAHCELDRRVQSNDRNNRTFVIRGVPDAVEHCKQIIMEKVGMPINFISEGGQPGGNGADYYGGGPSGPSGPSGPGGPAAWGYNPHWHPANNTQQPQQPQSQVSTSQGGQPDYSQQWIEYYRSLGMVREAEAIEQQAKQNKQRSEEETSAPQQQPQPQQSSTAQAAGDGQPDYSAQWANYYRSIGKIKQAEAIEAQMKNKAGGGAGNPQQPQMSQQSGMPNPGMGGPNPGMGGPNPGMGGPNPGMGGPNPGMGGPNPGMGGPNPGMGGPNPGMGGPNPGMGGPNPGMGGPNMGGFGGPQGYGGPMGYPGAPMPYPGYGQYPGAPGGFPQGPGSDHQ